ncbi:carboxymuconolactone decarboxylase family protein [Aldersonia kunmingensis]|uniref:carboxymuconolactone decarboxylase family protein n=1 Tax=Aldersonia kunmingensis TaxID=408066 RepID=UPI000833D621|nr:carboxymuconolactone decarboxylase family protein [Aldersonia kunmingensis]
MRLPPLPADEWDDEVRAALAGMMPRARQNPDDAGTALATLVRHPALTKAFLGLSIHLLFRSTLPARLRELAILRVAYRRDCEYESAHHVGMAAEVGISPEDVAGAQRGELADDFEQAVVRAVDELDEKSAITDSTWATLSAQLDERQLMDLIFTIGTYNTMAVAYNTFGVKPEQKG